jgi:hypothetical protein
MLGLVQRLEGGWYGFCNQLGTRPGLRSRRSIFSGAGLTELWNLLIMKRLVFRCPATCRGSGQHGCKTKPSIYLLLPPRSMVGQLPLEQPIGVRIPGGQPIKINNLPLHPIAKSLCLTQIPSGGREILILPHGTVQRLLFGRREREFDDHGSSHSQRRVDSSFSRDVRNSCSGCQVVEMT